MSPRLWATIGNIFRFDAVVMYLVGVFLGYRMIQLIQLGASDNSTLIGAAATVALFVIATLLWNLKGPLVSGNPIVRLLVGLLTIAWIVTSLGTALISIGIF